MTVSSSINRNDYAGNGSTTNFAVSFRFLQNSDIKATLRDALSTETLQVETTDYTLTGAGGAGGGTLVMIVAPPSGTTLTIQRDVPATQETDYVENDEFPAESHEDALDKLTMLVQQQGEDSTRHIGFTDTVSDATGAAVELSQDATQRADKFLGFDTAGNIVTKTASVAGLVDQAQQDKRYGPVFATVAAMTAANPVSIDGVVVTLVVGMTVNLQGYFVAGDGGGKIGLIAASQSVDERGDHTNDNGTVFLFQRTGPAFAQQYGALFDGATSDRAPIQAALDANTVVIGKSSSTAFLASQLTINPGNVWDGNGCTMTHGNHRVFTADGSSLETSVTVTAIDTTITADASNGFTGTIATVSSATGLAVGDRVYLFGDSLQAFFSVIEIINGLDITLAGRVNFTIGANASLFKIGSYNARIKNTTFIPNGVNVTTGSIILTKANDTYVEDCEFIGDASFTAGGVGFTRSTGWKVLDSKFRYTGTIGIAPFDSGPGEIRGNDMAQFGNGIRCVGPQGIIISGNRLENGSDDLFSTGIKITGDVTGDKAHNNIIDGNTVIHAGHGVAGSGTGGIHLNKSASYNVVSDNICQRNGFGIYMETECDYNVISGNNCSYNDGLYGVGIEADSLGDGNAFTGNVCNFNVGNTVQAESNGIQIRSGIAPNQEDTVVSGNMCSFNGLEGIRVVGNNISVTGNVCRGNGTIAGAPLRNAMFARITDGTISGNLLIADAFDAGATANFNQQGLHLNDCVDVVVSGNRIKGSFWCDSIFRLDGASSKIRVVNNSFKSIRGKGVDHVFIFGTSGVPLTQIQVSGNTIDAITGNNAMSFTWVAGYTVQDNIYLDNSNYAQGNVSLRGGPGKLANSTAVTVAALVIDFNNLLAELRDGYSI